VLGVGFGVIFFPTPNTYNLKLKTYAILTHMSRPNAMPGRIALTMIASTTYGLGLYLLLSGQLPSSAYALFVVPAVLVAWAWGAVVGVSVGLFASPLFLYQLEPLTGIAIPNAGGSFVTIILSVLSIGGSGIVGGLRDLSERQMDTEHALAEANAALRHKTEVQAKEMKKLHEVRDHLLQIIAHQFRTPLNAARWNVESLLTEKMGLTKRAEVTQETHEAILQLIHRVDDMLLVAEMDEGRVPLQKESVSIGEMVKRVAKELQPRAAAHNIRLRASAEHVPVVLADPARLREVMVRLVDNAILYSTDRGQVDIQVRALPDAVRVEVKDQGIGIPKDDQPHIFSRFFRATNARKTLHEASGLGLHVAKHLVELHGGRIGFNSKEEKGTVFWFEIPHLKVKRKR
jgi:signal transduction histidine kinase